MALFNDQQLRDFEVANENMLQPNIEDEDALQKFLRSEAYAQYLRFVLRLNEACTDFSISACRKMYEAEVASSESNQLPLVDGLIALLDRLNTIVDECPPLQQPTRFGNRAFQTFVSRVKERAASLIQECGLAMSSSPSDASSSSSSSSSRAPTVSATAVSDLCRYLSSCFGDAQRIDYGSGHEMNFVCLMACLSPLHPVLHEADRVLEHPSRSSSTTSSSPIKSALTSPLSLGFRSKSSDSSSPSFPSSPAAADSLQSPFTRAQLQDACLVLLVFSKYISLCRRLQRTYWLEPAGSRGVWGLDDHFFLPFYWGAAQLRHHRHLKPKSIRTAEVLEGFAADYLYFDAVRAIQQIKLASFAEHSPLLNDISEVKTWEKVNSGLLKMYRVEVLGKHAVVQHFIYTTAAPSPSPSSPSSESESEFGLLSALCLPSTPAAQPAPQIDVPVVHSVFGHEFHGEVADSRKKASGSGSGTMPNADLFAAPILSSGTNGDMASKGSFANSNSNNQISAELAAKIQATRMAMSTIMVNYSQSNHAHQSPLGNRNPISPKAVVSPASSASPVDSSGSKTSSSAECCDTDHSPSHQHHHQHHHHTHSSNSSGAVDQGDFRDMPCCSATIRLPSAAALAASSTQLRSLD